jgi:uncharacterized protein
METNNFNYVQQEETATLSKTFMASVFSWMSAALVITSVVAFYFGNNMELMSLLRHVDPISGHYSTTGLGLAVALSPLAFILVMTFGFNRLSYPVMLFIFLAFAATMGASLSYIFLRYTSGSILGTFMASSAMFGLMAVVGYTTKTDLTKFGSLLFMALIGMIFASIINFFMHSSQMSYIISFVGVLVFTGLTAYDVQKLKRLGAGLTFESDSTRKLVLWGALDLYLDFVNLFLFMLRLFGDRK